MFHNLYCILCFVTAVFGGRLYLIKIGLVGTSVAQALFPAVVLPILVHDHDQIKHLQKLDGEIGGIALTGSPANAKQEFKTVLVKDGMKESQLVLTGS